MVKKILLGLLMLFGIMQLLQPNKNVSDVASVNDISTVYAVPVDIQNVLTQKCYDCHSNNTRYPWYIHIQPIGWWMAAHIKDAKDELNFSEFKTYDQKKAEHKLSEMVEEIMEGEMPLKSYVWLHEEAKVTPTEAQAISDWVKSLGITVKED
jgi:hypothetical protein